MYKCAALLCSSLLVAACGGPSGKARKYETPTGDSIVTELKNRQAQTDSFLAESRMEYWVKNERIKTTVYVMGTKGARVRFNALDPTGSVAADLSCDGANFAFVDFNKNCQLSGPCTKSAIAQLLRVSLEPDDFLMLAVGSTPIIPYDNANVRWDRKKSLEIVELSMEDGSLRQTLVLDGREQRWDVLSATVWGADGEIEWKLTNKDFSDQKSEDGKAMRLPARTRFEQPKEKADLTIRWDERAVNTELEESKFFMQLPNVPTC